jgi:hypothetical protein
MRIEPAAGQRLTGGKDQIRFEKQLGLLQLLAGMKTALQVRDEGIKQGGKSQHLHQGAVMPGFQKHRASATAASGLPRLALIGRPGSGASAVHLPGDERAHRAPEQIGNQQQGRSNCSSLITAVPLQRRAGAAGTSGTPPT